MMKHGKTWFQKKLCPLLKTEVYLKRKILSKNKPQKKKAFGVYFYGAKRSIFQLSPFNVYRMRSCNRFGLPCQNSIDRGRTRYPPQCSGLGIRSTCSNSEIGRAHV